MNLAGIDASLNSTGICVITPEGTYFYTCKSNKLESRPSDVEKNQRLAKLVAEILQIIKKHDVKVVAIENYAFSKSSSSVTPLAELQGAIKVGLYFQKVLCCSLAVSTIRKFCVGKHIPKKIEFQREFKKAHHRLDTLPKNEDEWDAFAVAHTLDRGWRLRGDPDLHDLIGFHLSVPDKSLS